MVDVADTVDSLSRNITLLLRYVFPPIVGFLIVFVGYSCELDEMNKCSSFTGVHVFLMLLVLIALGLIVFHLHWSFLHFFIELVIVKIVQSIVLKGFRKPSMCDIRFARWNRRVPVRDDGKRKEAHEIQKFMDLTSTGGHFLYCSGYSALMWFGIFSFGLNKGSLTNKSFFWTVTIILFVIAIFSEFWTTKNDLIAYKKYNIDTA
jgi:hypothetical protein